MLIKRPPGKTLEQFVAGYWMADMRGCAPTPGARENVLPIGTTGIVFRLSGEPLKIFEGDEEKVFSPAVIGGARQRFYTKDIPQPAHSIGVVLKPEAAGALFGIPAGELKGHVSLEDVWGSLAGAAFERIAEAESPAAKFEIFESLLIEKIKNARAPLPIIVDAVKRLVRFESVDAVVRASGFSHRHFAQLFKRHTGLHPKAFSRIKRFQWAVRMMGNSGKSFSDIALDSGYSDQSHFTRNFIEFAGVTPGEYRKAAPQNANHVRVRPPFRQQAN
jgi:AraC-like DNA-binding protein